MIYNAYVLLNRSSILTIATLARRVMNEIFWPTRGTRGLSTRDIGLVVRAYSSVRAAGGPLSPVSRPQVFRGTPYIHRGAT